MHPLLQRQLRRLGIEPGERPITSREADALLERVSASYRAADQDRYLMERSLRMASDEMRTLYEARQEAAEERIQQLRESANDVIYTRDLAGRLTSINRAGEALTGFTRAELIGRDWRELLAPRHRASVDDVTGQLERELDGESLTEVEIVSRDGRHIPLEISNRPLLRDGELHEVLGVGRDISERRMHERRLQHLAHHDSFTNLPNRLVLEEALREAIAEAVAGSRSALALVDIDNFKLVNDTLGHGAGDQILITAARAIEAAARPALVVRLSGDEFAVLLRRSSLDDALAAAERIRQMLERPDVWTAGGLRYLSVSVGVSEVTASAEPTAIIAEVDASMYAAKEQGKNRVVWAGAASATDAAGQLGQSYRLVEAMRQALESGGFELHYQPIVDLERGSTHAFEALVRLRGEDGRMIPPGEFLPTAERFGLMPAIDRYVADVVIGRLLADPRAVIYLNVSPLSLAERRFSADLLATLGREPGLGRRLGVELTESAALRDLDLARGWVERLRSFGCRVALDDFGTGFNSLRLAQELPVTDIKIDGSFVEQLETDPKSRAVVAAIQAFAEGLGMSTVAEHIETPQQLATVRAMGITYGQGYLLGRPSAELRAGRAPPLRSSRASIPAARRSPARAAMWAEPPVSPARAPAARPRPRSGRARRRSRRSRARAARPSARCPACRSRRRPRSRRAAAGRSPTSGS